MLSVLDEGLDESDLRVLVSGVDRPPKALKEKRHLLNVWSSIAFKDTSYVRGKCSKY